MRIRPVRLASDLGRVLTLLEEAESVDGHHPLGEHKYLTLMSGSPDEVVGLVAELDDELTGYVALTPSREQGWWAMEVAMAPRHRTIESFLDLLRAGVDEVRSRRGSAIRAWIFQPRLAEAAVRAGFAPERELFKLELQLPLGLGSRWPEGVRAEPFVVGKDEDSWLAVNNAAFLGHPENGRWTREVLDDRFSQPWFRAEDLVMAWRDGDLAGFCWVKPAEKGGEIYVIAVAPAHQGRGLGRALLVDGLNRIEAAGGRSAFLYVDAGNQAALALYRSIGFYLDHVDRSYVRRLD
jgi:mycothiol synthase